VILCSFCAVASAQSRTITEWAVPTLNSKLAHVVAASSTIIYFTEANTNKVGQLNTTTNTITEWNLPSSSVPHYITTTASGLAFCALGTSYIAFLNPSNSILTQWQLPTLSPAHL